MKKEWSAPEPTLTPAEVGENLITASAWSYARTDLLSLRPGFPHPNRFSHHVSITTLESACFRVNLRSRLGNHLRAHLVEKQFILRITPQHKSPLGGLDVTVVAGLFTFSPDISPVLYPFQDAPFNPARGNGSCDRHTMQMGMRYFLSDTPIFKKGSPAEIVQ